MEQGRLTHCCSSSLQGIQVIFFFFVTKFFSGLMLHHILSLPFNGVSERIKVCVKISSLDVFWFYFVFSTWDVF